MINESNLMKVVNGGSYWQGHAVSSRPSNPDEAWKFLSYGKGRFCPVVTENIPYGDDLAHVFVILPDGNLYKLSLAEQETLKAHRHHNHESKTVADESGFDDLDEAIMSMGYVPGSASPLGIRTVGTGSAKLAYELASYLRGLGFRAQASSFGIVTANPNH